MEKKKLCISLIFMHSFPNLFAMNSATGGIFVALLHIDGGHGVMAGMELVQFSRQHMVMQHERNIDIHSTSVDQTTSLSSTVLRLKFLRLCFTRVNFFPV